MAEFDRALFLLINGVPTSSSLVVGLAILLAKYAIVLIPAHMMLVWAGGDRSMRFVALAGLLALVIAIVVNQAIGLVFYRPRPFLVGLGHALIDHRASSSMPSNHATVFFVYAATLALFSRVALAAAVAALGLAVAWSRIFLGIHYPLDMLAATLTSTAAALAATWITARWGRELLAACETLQMRAFDVVAVGSTRLRRGR